MASEHSDDTTIFVSDVDGPEDLSGFFEDDGETGYLYISDKRLKKVTKHLQIYSHADAIDASEDDIRVVWSSDATKCGVFIFDGMRGIIDVRKGVEARTKMIDRSTPPISDAEWLKGFEKYYS
jgi:hypothetical protein